jgi:predicted dehydrogenase
MALKVGVVGARGIGEHHAACHAADPLAQLVAVCDVVKERAEPIGAKHGVKVYRTPGEMLDAHPDLDVVDVCTGGFENGGWHFEPAVQALEAGKHVLVEKPISNDIHEARELVRLAAEKDLYLGCNLNHYFTEPARQARVLMNEGKIGEHVYCLHRMGFFGGEATYSAPGGGGNFDGFPHAHLKAFLAHPFSLMRHFCGDITHIQAFLDRPGCRRTHSDLMLSIASIHVRFVSGAVGYMFSSRGDTSMGMGGWWSFELGGTRGTFCIENCVEKLTYYPAPEPGQGFGLGFHPAPQVTNTGITDFGLTFPARIHAFLEDVTAQVPKNKLRASGRDALATLEYTFAAIDSGEQGGALVRPHPLPTLKRDLRDQ